MPTSAVAFTALAGGLLFLKSFDKNRPLDVDGVDDRAFRLAHHAGQNTVDRYTYIGVGVGAAAGAILGRAAVRSVIASGLTGAAIGVAAYGIETIALPALSKMGDN